MSKRRRTGSVSNLPLDVVRQIDALCDAYESALKSDPAAPISPYLARIETSWQGVLERELIALAQERSEHPPSLGIQTAAQQDVPAHGSSSSQPQVRVVCPSCQKPVEIRPDDDLKVIRCGFCSIKFRPTIGNQATNAARVFGEVNQFDLIEQVGIGSFGAVWKAYDRRLQRTVALKFGRRGQFNSQQQISLIREARAAAGLQHPGIVPVFDVGQDGDTFFIVSEFIRGVTLSDWMIHRHPDPELAVEIVTEVADALHHAHEQGIIHRDIKPGNIMIVGDSSPKLMDFGLAKHEAVDATITAAGHVLGTPAYMSPEQARGDSNSADSRSDIYSLGVVLFQLLTGELPFQGEERALLHQVLHADPPSVRDRNPGIPRDLESIVMKCLAKNPRSRPASARDLASGLRVWRDRQSGQTTRSNSGGAWMRKSWIPLGATLLLLLVSAGIVATTMMGPATDPTETPIVDTELPKKIEAAENENRELRKQYAEESRKLQSILREIERLSPPLRTGANQSSQFAPALLALGRNLAAPATPLASSAAYTLAAQVAIPDASSVVGAANAQNLPAQITEQQRLQQLLNENLELTNQLGDLKAQIVAANERLEMLRAFSDASVILTEGQASAVALNRSGDHFVVTAVGREAEMPLISRMIKRSGRQVLSEYGSLTRELKSLGSGATVTDRGQISQLQEIYTPRKYVPDQCLPGRMVAFQSSDLQGEYVLGYLLSNDTDENQLAVATTSLSDEPLGVKTYSRANVIGYPIVGEGVELLAMEPGLRFADYAILRAARELKTSGPAVHQAVAVQTVVRVNPAFIKNLSAYSSENSISWLAVAADNARMRGLISSGVLPTQGVEYRALLEVMAQALETDLAQAASALGIPLVTRDRESMLRLTEEDAIARGASPLPRAEFVLRSMREAADRGSLAYANIEHEGVTRRVVMRQEDTQAFQSAAKQWGQSQFRRGSASGAVGLAAGGYGYGYGGGGAYRLGRRGGAYGYGGGGGGGHAHLRASAAASAVREDFLFSNGQLYESRGKQTYLDDLSDEQARDAYKSVVFAEQAAKRDAELTVMDYGSLASATHVLRIDVTQGRTDDSVRYKVSLQKIDGRNNQLGAIEVPLHSPRRSTSSYIVSGDLTVINNGIRGDAEYAPLKISPQGTERRPYPPAFVLQSLTDPAGKTIGLRSLFEEELITRSDPKKWARLGKLVRGKPQPVTVGASLQGIPSTQKMRVAFHEIMRHLRPLAGEVVEVDQDAQRAVVRIHDPYRKWQPGDRLIVERPSLNGRLQYLPFDLRVDRNDDGLVTVKYKTGAELLWSQGKGLQVGDRVSSRAAEEIKVGVRSPWFFFTSIPSWDLFRNAPDSRDVADDDFPPNAIPDDNAVRLIYARTGWRKVRGELQTASSNLTKQIIVGLKEYDVEVTRYTGDDAVGIEKLVHMELVPYASGRAQKKLGYRLNVEIRTPTSQQSILSFDVDPALLGTWSALGN